MKFSVFAKIARLVCLAIVLSALAACGGGQVEDALIIDEPAPSPTQKAADVEIVEDGEEIAYLAEILELQEELYGLWHVADPGESEWFVGDETVEFFVDGTGRERLLDIEWTFTWRIDPEYPRFLLWMLHDEFEMGYYLDIVGDGRMFLFDSAGAAAPTVLTRNPPAATPQPAPVQAASDEPWFIGRWLIDDSTMGYHFPDRLLTLELMANGQGRVLGDGLDSSFTWKREVYTEGPDALTFLNYSGHGDIEFGVMTDSGNTLPLRYWAENHTYVFTRAN